MFGELYGVYTVLVHMQTMETLAPEHTSEKSILQCVNRQQLPPTLCMQVKCTSVTGTTAILVLNECLPHLECPK